MAYNIKITQSFEDDLAAVLEYISQKLYNSDAARRLLINAEEKISLIGENPLLYPLYHDDTLSEKGYHYVPVANYLIFYRIDESNKTIFITRFLYGGQNISTII